MCGASLLNPIENQSFSQGFDAKLIIATGALRASPQLLRFPPLTKTPLWKPPIFRLFKFGEGPPVEPRHKVFSLKFLSSAVQGHGNLRLKFLLKFFALNVLASKKRPKTSWKTSRQTSRKISPRTDPLQNGNFAQNFALQKPFSDFFWSFPGRGLFVDLCRWPTISQPCPETKTTSSWQAWRQLLTMDAGRPVPRWHAAACCTVIGTHLRTPALKTGDFSKKNRSF